MITRSRRSTLSVWRNHEHVEGGRFALGATFNEHWSASLTYSYQRQHTKGAYDEDLANNGPRAVARFGPEGRENQAKLVDFHVDGDVGVGRPLPVDGGAARAGAVRRAP